MDFGKCVSTDANGNVYVVGYYESPTLVIGTSTLTNAGNPDVFIAKMDGSGTGMAENINAEILRVYPNPFSWETTLWVNNELSNATLTVENVFGQTVAQITNISGQTVTLQRHSLPAGLYFIRLTEYNKEIVTKKVIIAD
jgi:hypothetical protein